MEQLVINGVEPEVKNSNIPSNLALKEKLKLFARYLIYGFTDEGESIDYQWQAAYYAGIGNSKDSASTLSTRYLNNPIVIAEMALQRAKLEGEAESNRAELFGYWRKLVQENTGERKVRKPTQDANGNVTGFVDAYHYEPVVAEKVLEKMAKAAKVLDDGKVSSVANAQSVVIVGKSDMQEDEWLAAYGG